MLGKKLINKTVLITGGAGFIGSLTANKLSEIYETIIVVDNYDDKIHRSYKSALVKKSNIIIYKENLYNEKLITQLLRETNIIYHFVSETGVGESMYNLSLYCNQNVTLTAFIWQIILKNKYKIDKFILSSSRAVYGEGSYLNYNKVVYPGPRNPKNLKRGCFMHSIQNKNIYSVPIDENCLVNPNSIYGYTKLWQEHICQLMGKTLNIPIIILRYFNVYGSNQSVNNPYTGVLAAFYRCLRENKPIELYENGKPERDFVHVDDVVRCNVQACKLGIKEKIIINIGSGEKVTLKQLAEQFIKVANKDTKIILTGRYRIGDVFSTVSNTSKMESILGKCKINLHSGLKELITGWDKVEFKANTNNHDPNLKKYGLSPE